MKPSLAVLAWIAGLFITLVTVGSLRKRAVLDIPTDRSMHSVPTPRGGGLGIVAGFFIPALGLMFTDSWTYELVSPLLLGGIPIAVIGWMDDKHHVSPKWRALVHLVSCLIAFSAFSFFTHDISFFADSQNWIWLTLVTVGSAYFLNIYNFMDGLDGLAGSEGAFACIVAAGLFRGQSLIYSHAELFNFPSYELLGRNQSSSGLAGLLGFCCVGFLIWNWPPAKIFMGDVGSGFLGFAIAFLALASTRENPSRAWPWLILLGVFIVDGTVTLLTRLVTRQKWYEAHSLHAFQKAAKRKSHVFVTLAVIAINFLWLLPLASYAEGHPGLGVKMVSLAYAPLIVLALLLKSGRKEPKLTGVPPVTQ